MPRLTYSERAAKFEMALEEAKARSDADDVLSVMLADPAYDGREKLLIVGALGDFQGRSGSAAIRKAFAHAMTGLAAARPTQRSDLKDLLCAAVWALWKRDGGIATDVYVAAGFHASKDVSSYGMRALASDGDDRVWDKVMSALTEILRRKVSAGTHRSYQALLAIEYLARNAEPGTDRAIRLVTLVRDRWRSIEDRAWLEVRWPGIASEGPPPDRVSLNLARQYVQPRPWERP